MSPCGSQPDGQPRGVYNPQLDECRCTAGWDGRFCARRHLRPCNAPLVRAAWSPSLCAGNCDEQRGSCFCAGLPLPFQRVLPDRCSPAVHARSRLPDGRPALPLRTSSGAWVMHPLVRSDGWSRQHKKPFEYVYGELAGNPVMRRRGRWEPLGERVAYCAANTSTPRRLLALTQCDAMCPDNRRGRLCEKLKDSFCLRSCSGRGRCDLGFCWCEAGWFGIDCSLHLTQTTPRRQDVQQLPSLLLRARPPLELRLYVYEMPAEFTTRLLQYRGDEAAPHREINKYNAHQFSQGSLYAAEIAFRMQPSIPQQLHCSSRASVHEWLLDSHIRTLDGEHAHLFFVPIYLSSLFIWPVSGFAEEPYYGRSRNESRLRGYQGSLLMLRALQYVRSRYPFWNASGGVDHVWMMLHDEGPCLCPREIRPSILLTHYGYYAERPKAWTTFADDNFLSSPRFYQTYLGDARHPTRCFTPGKDIVIPPWKYPGFWRAGLSKAKIARQPHRKRRNFVFFAGELGRQRAKSYSHQLRQTALSLFCNPAEHREARARGCSLWLGGCRPDLPMNCSRWRQGVVITEHVNAYGKELADSTFCLAFPGDGWSSRVLDAVVHGCVPVIVQDESLMFFEGIFSLVGAKLDYADFSIRVPEGDLPRLLEYLDSVSHEQLMRYQRNVLWVRDYYVYKDLWSSYRFVRKELMSRGRAGQDAFLMLALALEGRARTIGTLVPLDATPASRAIVTMRSLSRLTSTQWLSRNYALLNE
ncbi:hypothetical protein AB1Y20_022912 [Prymnesium parvum]|uniref:Exostosin GT47 domain-containing protein n=1 Tax=Prymnesium parvum TaxID=97485 RepID=A0AB34JE05_PRYPA